MKRYSMTLRKIATCLCLSALCACSDFFEPENNTTLYGDKYMSEVSEMYAGYLGVITKVQAMADKPIYLLDSRAEMLVATDRSVEMNALSTYESNLTGNSLADPAVFYDAIIACNDYLQKVKEYKDTHVLVEDDKDNYAGLVSSTIRLKAWIYFTMAKIYNEVVWFDDPMQSMKDYSEYPRLDLDDTIEKCWELLHTAYDGVDIATAEMDWRAWIAKNDESISDGTFELWNRLVPPYFTLAADLALWRGDFQKVIDLIIPELNEAFGSSSANTKWMCGTSYSSAYNKYDRIFAYGQPNSIANVAAIIYDRQNNQTNQTNSHLYSSARLLKPTEAAVARYSDPTFDPQDKDGGTDGRLSKQCDKDSYGGYRMKKWRYGSDNFIYLYRNVELYFMLIEAYNNLERYGQMEMLMNAGVGGTFPDGGVSSVYPEFSNDWTRIGDNVTHVDGDLGVRHVWFGANGYRTMLRFDSNEYTAAEARRHNDMELLKEICLEMPAEGKTLPAMIRMARRYNDPTIVSDLVCGKYQVEDDPATAALEQKVRPVIESGNYFVNWDIDSMSEH